MAEFSENNFLDFDIAFENSSFFSFGIYKEVTFASVPTFKFFKLLKKIRDNFSYLNFLFNSFSIDLKNIDSST